MFDNQAIHFSRHGRVATVDANALGRDYVVGDIHGYYTSLAELLEQVGFDPECDRLFSVGDLVDRGPENREAIDWLESGRIALAIVGNHEEMMLRALLGRPLDDDASAYMAFTEYGEHTAHRLKNVWSSNGGDWWDRGIDELRGEQETQRWIRALESLPYAATIETPHGRIGLVHACPLWKRWDDFLDAMENGSQDARTRAVWNRQRACGLLQREFDNEPNSSQGSVPEGDYEDVRAVMAGHTPVEEVQWDANLLNLDSGVQVYGRLTMACVNMEEITLHSIESRWPNRRGRFARCTS